MRPRLAVGVLYLVLIAAAVVTLFPFVWMVLTSLKSEAEIVTYPPKLFPDRFTLESVVNIWERLPFLTLFRNSVIFAFGVTLISLVFDSMAAFAFSRLHFPGRDKLFILVLVALMIPVQVTMIPLFLMLGNWGWLDTFLGLIVPRATNAFGIFMLRQFFINLPKELDESARIDGASEWTILWRIVTPLLGPAVASLLRGTYNDKVGSALLTAAAEMTLFAGWTAFDTEHHGQAQHYYGQALKLAKAADDPLAGAHVLSTMAHQAIHLNKPEKALLLARAAVEAGRRAQASPQVMALLHVREARAAALRAHPAANGDRHTAKQIERLLLEAERAHGQGASDRDPQWACEFDEPELAAQFGIVWHLLGDNDRAADHLEHSIRAFATYRPRSSHLNRVNVAETYLSKGELEQALDHARAATTGATALTSPRLIGHVKRFDKRLKPYENTIQVREFRAYLDHATAV